MTLSQAEEDDDRSAQPEHVLVAELTIEQTLGCDQAHGPGRSWTFERPLFLRGMGFRVLELAKIATATFDRHSVAQWVQTVAVERHVVASGRLRSRRR